MLLDEYIERIRRRMALEKLGMALEKLGMAPYDRYKGIKYYVYSEDSEHGKPHVHMIYQDDEMKIDLESEKTVGSLKPAQMSKAMKWLRKNKKALLNTVNWKPKHGE